jgi:TonB-dependent receptor
MDNRQRRDGWNISVLGSVSMLTALVCTAAAPQAIAQTAASDDAVEEVVVVGYRQSLNASLNLKREATGAVDAIVAEDIADFPDLNLAEAVQRVPGVSIQRDAGEGRQITVRGLGPEFTRIRLNGVEAMSANGGTDAAGGTNRARNFDFNTFASDLFSAITVRKTAAADTDEGSLGATVDLRTGRPFDYKGFTFAASADGSYNDLAGKVDPRAAMLVSNVFADGKFGALFSAAYTDRSLVDEGSSTVRWQQSAFSATVLPSNPEPLADINTSFVPRIPRYDYYQHSQQRIGLTGALQFRPAEGTQINVDGLWAKFRAQRQEIFLEVPNFSSATNGITVADAFIDRDDATATSSGTLRYGVFNNVDIRVEDRMDRLTTEFTQATIDGTHAFSDKFRLNALVGFAESNHENPLQTTLTFDWNNIPSMTYDYRDNSRAPVISYGTTDLTSQVNGTPQTGATSTVDSGGWYLSQIRLRPQSSINSFLNYQADLEWDLADAMKLRVGGQYKTYIFKTTELRRSNGTTTNLEGTVTAGQRAVPLSSYSHAFTFPSDIGMPAASTDTFLLPDLSAGATLLSLYDATVFPLGPEPALNNNREIDEDDSGGFTQLDFHSSLGGRTLRGNLGVRYVKTKQKSIGYTFLSGSPVLIVAQRDYADTLPSLNLALDLTDQMVLRFGAAKVMSRPALGTLTPGGTVNVSGNNRVATLGNPNIDPTRAKNYDLGFEWYFAKESLLALALFYKDIESRPQGLTATNQVFTGNPFGIPDSVAIAACGALPNCAPDLPIWTFNTTINGPGGNLKGFELSFQQPFTFLPGIWSNFGAIVNYTGVESSIKYIVPNTTTTQTTDLTGLSRKAYNATLYYETKRFGARVSAAYRAGYIDPNAGVPGQNGNNLGGVKSTLTIDTSARYNVTDAVQITLEGLNLTDEYQDQWVDIDADRPSFYHHTGRTFILGARVKF